MSKDPYDALGVKKTASADEIKKAYKRVVRESHPDLHPDDPGAEARFKAASAAYDLLKDPQTRARFDRGEIDATGAERAQRHFYRDFAGGPGGGAGGGGGFGPGYGGGRGGGQDAHADGQGFDPAEIFAEILRGRGRGGEAGGGGGGFRGWGGAFGGGGAAHGADIRYALDIDFLDAVRGARKPITLPDGARLEVSIPAGANDGQTLRLRGKGAPGQGGGKPGDALVTLSVRPHPDFHREGDDIHSVLPITLDEAVLGAKVAAPTIAGPVNLTVPRGASSGQVLRLRGRGIKPQGSERAGDQLVELRIVLPREVDDELADFMTRWRESHRYDPRRGGSR